MNDVACCNLSGCVQGWAERYVVPHRRSDEVQMLRNHVEAIARSGTPERQRWDFVHKWVFAVLFIAGWLFASLLLVDLFSSLPHLLYRYETTTQRFPDGEIGIISRHARPPFTGRWVEVVSDWAAWDTARTLLFGFCFAALLFSAIVLFPVRLIFRIVRGVSIFGIGVFILTSLLDTEAPSVLYVSKGALLVWSTIVSTMALRLMRGDVIIGE